MRDSADLWGEVRSIIHATSFDVFADLVPLLVERQAQVEVIADQLAEVIKARRHVATYAQGPAPQSMNAWCRGEELGVLRALGHMSDWHMSILESGAIAQAIKLFVQSMNGVYADSCIVEMRDIQDAHYEELYHKLIFPFARDDSTWWDEQGACDRRIRDHDDFASLVSQNQAEGDYFFLCAERTAIPKVGSDIFVVMLHAGVDFSFDGPVVSERQDWCDDETWSVFELVWRAHRLAPDAKIACSWPYGFDTIWSVYHAVRSLWSNTNPSRSSDTF